MKNLTQVNFIAIHCAGSRPDRYRMTIEDIRTMHLERGFSDIGYHYYIDTDGNVFDGRSEAYTGAHEPRINSNSIAICLEGGYRGKLDYPAPQLDSLRQLIKDLRVSYSSAVVVGHNTFREDKTCPNFNVPLWWEENTLEKI